MSYMNNLSALPLALNNLRFMTDSSYEISKPFVADYKFSARNADFNEWMLCDGRSLDIEDYQQLYQVIGTSFGDNGVGTFRLPNCVGRVPACIGQVPSGVNHVLGHATGAETHTLTINEMPSHNHSINDPGHLHAGDTFRSGTQDIVAASGSGITAADEGFSSDNVSTATTGITINNTGGGLAHNNMQPTLFIGNLFIFSGKRAPNQEAL